MNWNKTKKQIEVLGILLLILLLIGCSATEVYVPRTTTKINNNLARIYLKREKTAGWGTGLLILDMGDELGNAINASIAYKSNPDPGYTTERVIFLKGNFPERLWTQSFFWMSFFETILADNKSLEGKPASIAQLYMVPVKAGYYTFSDTVVMENNELTLQNPIEYYFNPSIMVIGALRDGDVIVWDRPPGPQKLVAIFNNLLCYGPTTYVEAGKSYYFRVHWTFKGKIFFEELEEPF